MTAFVKELRRSLARDLFAIMPGSAMPPIRDLARRHGASVGATQGALAGLVADGAVSLDSRPGRGAVLVDRHIGRLYGSLEAGPLLVCLSLPSTERIYGLATAIKATLASAGLESYLVFTRGSRPRLDSLRQGRNHMAIVSALAAEALGPPDLATVLVLAPNSFVREHRVYFVERPHAGRLRVAIDPSSLDFERLTLREFAGQDVRFVPLNYLTTIREMEAGAIDAAILDVEDVLMRFPPHISSRPLSPALLTELDHANTRAAFVCRTDDQVVRTIAQWCLPVTDLETIQQEVITGHRPPDF
jgi:hypothetical protein